MEVSFNIEWQIMRYIQTSQRDGFTGTDFETQNFLIFCVVVVS